MLHFIVFIKSLAVDCGFRKVYCVVVMLLCLSWSNAIQGQETNTESQVSDKPVSSVDSGTTQTAEKTDATPMQVPSSPPPSSSTATIDAPSIHPSEPAPIQPAAQSLSARTQGPVAPEPSVNYEERTYQGDPALYIPGFVVFGVSYIPTVIGASFVSMIEAAMKEEFDDDGPKHPYWAEALIPLAGPWILLAQSGSSMFCVLMVAAGVIQIVGASLAIVGLVLNRTERVPIDGPDKSKKKKTRRAPTIYVSPYAMGTGGAGLGLRVVNY
jgi:hypothetical protein